MTPTPIIVILGPTASGKSDLAVRLAEEFNGEVISADSRQVYRGMDIGTGKITRTEMRGVPHHLLDIEDPQNVFTVADFQRLAREAIAGIDARGKLPIICGGTGFYIDSLVGDTALPNVAADPALRAKLEKMTVDQILVILTKLDKARAESMNESDRKNPRRLIRAVETATALKHQDPLNSSLKNVLVVGSRTMSEGRGIHSPAIQHDHNSSYSPIFIGLNPPKDLLRKRIHDRLLQRMGAGMVAEIEHLHEGGVSWQRLEQLGLEYRYVAYLLQGKMTEFEMIEKLELAIWHYAKRQMTWFRRNKIITWFDATINETLQKIISLCRDRLPRK